MNIAEPYSYEDKVVAFVDILGFRNKTKDSQSIAKKSVHTALKEIHDYVNSPKTTEKFGSEDNQHYVFSDSSLFSCPLDNTHHLIPLLAELQFRSAKNGFFMRGGVTYNKIFDENNFFYGEGLNKAYELESTTASYPRIIFDAAFPFDEIDTTGLKRDFDGCYYIDFLRYQQHSESSEDLYTAENYNKIRNFIIDEIHQNKNKTYILAKYFWLAKYFNKSVNTNKITVTNIDITKLINNN